MHRRWQHWNGLYVPGSVNLDGVSYVQANSVGVLAPSRTWLLSSWLRFTTNDEIVAIVGDDHATMSHFLIDLAQAVPDTTILFGAANDDDDSVAGAVSNDVFATDINWHHLLISFDLANSSTRRAYFDGVQIGNFPFGTFVDDDISLADERLWIGNGKYQSFANTNPFIGDLGPFIMSNTFLDLDVQANVELFIKDGKPVRPVYGDWPIVFDGPAGAWHVNKGTLGDVFSEIGTLTPGQVPVELA